MSGKTEERTLQVAERFAAMMIERMEALAAESWKKPWLTVSGRMAAMPQNITGRNYSGSNSFFLQILTAKDGYTAPLYMTFQQAHNLGAKVKKGEKAWPVVYWDVVRLDASGKKVSEEDFRAMSELERKDIRVIPFVRTYPVFNVDQTDLKESNPKKYDSLLAHFPEMPKVNDTMGMYTNAGLDRLVERGEWVCPIKPQVVDRAYYTLSRDEVVLPVKSLFKVSESADGVYRDGMQYYSTMLHEMTHSTLTPQRLNRKPGGKFGDPQYAKEELVAEMTAAMVGASMGFDKLITDSSAKYLDAWIKTLREEPKFILSVMADVNKAADVITAVIDRQRIALGQTPLLEKNNPDLQKGQDVLHDITIAKSREGTYTVHASYDGIALGVKPLDKEAAKLYFSMTDIREKDAYKQIMAEKLFKSELAEVSRTKSISKSRCSM